MNLSGIFPPIATPFGDGDLDDEQLTANSAKWMQTGIAGIVVLGSNGEAVLMSDAEADRAVAAVRAAMPRGRTLIAGTGRESTAATIEATRRAAKAGADVALVRTPSYYKSQMTTDVFVRHFTAVADASPIPILLYNVTVFTGVNLLPAAVTRLADHPNIVGVKESGGDLAQIGDLIAQTPDDFIVLVGSAPTLYASFCVGADGAIVAAACVVPDACVRLQTLVREGRHAEARELQVRLTPLARSVTSVYGLGGLKAALRLAGYPSGDPRPPIPPAPESAVDIIRAQLAAIQQIEITV
jgi:4-hydroxy-2-oxoglutarate aldolase